MSDIEKKIMEIFTDTLQLEDDLVIDPEASFEELEIDSLDLLEVVTNIERSFDISIPDDALLDIHSAGDAIAYVEKLVLAK